MTTSFTPHPDAPTVVRPQLAVAPAPAAPTWRGGWLVSGFAVVFAVAALGVVGSVALDTMTGSQPALAPAVTPAAPAPISTAPAATTALATGSPAKPDRVRVVTTTQIVVVPAPMAAPAPSRPAAPVADPVVVPPTPVVTPPKPPVGIGTCDLIACDTAPQTPQAPQDPPTHCGDFVACQPLPSRTAS